MDSHTVIEVPTPLQISSPAFRVVRVKNRLLAQSCVGGVWRTVSVVPT